MAKRDLVDLARVLCEHVGAGGFNALMGVKLERLDEGVIDISITVRKELTQHHGYVHGAVVGGLADTACAWAAATTSGDVVTAGYTIQFLAPAKGERVIAEARVIKSGKRLVAVEARVFTETTGEARRLVATALASIATVAADNSLDNSGVT
jgi:uncharacterized protein (TIGR00369 family)